MVDHNKHLLSSFIRLTAISLFALLFFSACAAHPQTISATAPLPEASKTTIPTVADAIINLPSMTATTTITPGPSPTSTNLPPLEANTWQAAPIMIQAARIGDDSSDPFDFTPLLVLYGDGLLVKRTCQMGTCQYQQAILPPEELCRLINTVDRTGFLSANPTDFSVPDGSGGEFFLAVQVYKGNSVQIPDLDRWIETPNWFAEMMGCVNCFKPPVIDPAFIDLYRLLTTYTPPEMAGLSTNRLALWIAKPVIAGSPHPWSTSLTPLAELAKQSDCQSEGNRQGAVILEGAAARETANFLANQGDKMPLFSENNQTWQVQARWLLPYEMPQTCQQPPGLYPPAAIPATRWSCQPEMGAIPTATATITPTPTNTRTPLR